MPDIDTLRNKEYNFFDKNMQIVIKNNHELKDGKKKPKNLFEDMLV